MAENTFPGRETDWNGYRKYSFTIDGIPAVLVKPNCEEAPGKPWYWRARFFGGYPDGDLALLKLGWTVVHINIDELFGCPESNRRFDLMYQFMIEHGYNKKCVPVGYSRGGLDVYLWAVKNLDKISCMYLDNAVCDIKSWPAGKGKGHYNPESWQNCLREWGFTEEQALAFKGNPIDILEPIAKSGIPVLHLIAEEDTVVPPEENGYIVERKMKELGGNLTVIRKPGMEHHPHCLSDPTPIVEFVLKAQAEADKQK